MKNQSLEIIKLNIQPENGSFLYRYITIDKLIDTLINFRFPLTRLNLYEDKLEGITPQHLLLNLASDKIAKDYAEWMGEAFNFMTINCNANERNSLQRQRIDFQNFNFANCWFNSDYESIAMWQLYSKHDSVAIRIPYLSLIEQIEKKSFELSGYDQERIRFGSVQYYKFDDLYALSKLVIKEDIQGFVKDKSFAHENEFRIILSIKHREFKKAKPKSMVLDEQIEKLNNQLDLKIIYYKLYDFQKMPFEIIFHPQSSSWHRENITNILSIYNLTFKIHESGLKRIFN